MINLIPPQARKNVKIEYWTRVVSVWFLLLTFAVFISGTLLVPSLISINSQLSINGSIYQVANDQNNVYEDLEKSVSRANSVAQRLVSLDNETSFTQLIFDLESVTGSLVEIKSVSFERTEGKVEAIKVTGSAVSRSALVEFRDALESHETFGSVELPLSNLAKDKDVPFNIVISVRNETQS